MKKLCALGALLISSMLFSQNDNQLNKKHELSTNLLDLVVAGSLNINYEHLLKNNQSYAVNLTFFDTYGYYDVGYIEKNSAISLKVSYILYFKKNKDHAGFFFYPQIKARTGEITVDDYGYYDFEGNFLDDSYTYDISGFSIGFGLGHKWIFNEKFTLGIQGDIARNLGNIDKNNLGIIEPRFGVNFGIRF